MDERTAHCLIRLLKSKRGTIDYITRLIVLSGSGILLGPKPGCTVTFTNDNSPENPYKLWGLYKDKIFQGSSLEFFELYDSSKHIVVLTFDRNKLNNFLENNGVLQFLHSLGYEANCSLEDKLYILKNKFKSSVPHEIGIFLGIPLKDVMGFMGLNNLQLSCCFGWKIYGDPKPSVELSALYEQCRNRMIHILANCSNPQEILASYN